DVEAQVRGRGRSVARARGLRRRDGSRARRRIHRRAPREPARGPLGGLETPGSGLKMAAAAIDRALAAFERAPLHRPTGVVLDVVGLVVEVGGPRGAVGEPLDVLSESGERLAIEVVGFRSGRVLATPLGPLKGIRAGAAVTTSVRGSTIAVGEGLLGRVVDAVGMPLHGGAPLRTTGP